MTSTGSGGRMRTRGGGSAQCGRPHRKILIRANLRHPVFFTCKEVGIFWTRISSLDGIKSGNFSSIYINNINY